MRTNEERPAKERIDRKREQGTGSGTFAGESSWENAPGALLDIATVADRLAAGEDLQASLKGDQRKIRIAKLAGRDHDDLEMDQRPAQDGAHGPTWPTVSTMCECNYLGPPPAMGPTPATTLNKLPPLP